MNRRIVLCFAVLLFALPLSVSAKDAPVFDQKKWDQALKTFQQEFTCKSCNPKHIKLITKAKINPTALRFKFLNILWSAPSQDRLSEYTTPQTLSKVEAFIQDHKDDLCEVYKETRVSPMVLTSLLYMETLFGSEAIPWFSALDSIVSLALLEQDLFSTHVIEALTPHMEIYDKYKKDPDKWKKYDWDKRAKWIAADWKNHLEAYLTIANMQNWDDEKVLTMKSSWAGAIGYSQFMPASALPYFHEDPTLDFWQWKDSFKLTSMYLKDHGFAQDDQKALKAYNSPRWYRETITHLSHIMKHKHPSFCQDLQS